MLLTYIWISMLLFSVLYSIMSGTTAETGAAALEGAQRGVSLAISISGALCLWSGLARVMKTSGLAEKLARRLRPLLSRLFPDASQDPEALENLCGNFTANLLGLGNAATPLGIAAVRRMKLLSPSESASDEICRFIVLNTASVQLIPSTVAAIRASLGAAAPLDLLPAVWITSICSVSVGLLSARFFAGWWRG